MVCFDRLPDIDLKVEEDSGDKFIFWLKLPLSQKYTLMMACRGLPAAVER